ncbi:MAG: tyrosine-type recombinase/integrase [Rhodococcus sp. (in: high G+C Gram-positive bacteria)]
MSGYDTPLSALVDDWAVSMARRGILPHDLKPRLAHLRRFVLAVSLHVSVGRDVTMQAVLQWLALQEGGWHAGRPVRDRNNARAAMFGFLRWAYGAGNIPFDVAKTLPPDSTGPRPREFPPLWEDSVVDFLSEQHAAARSATTIATRRSHLLILSWDHDGRSPLDLDRGDLIRWFEGKHQWRPSTRKSVRTTVRGFYRFLVASSRLDADPSLTLPPVSMPRSKPKPVPSSRVRSALDSLDDPRTRLMVLILANTGMRRAELARMRRDDMTCEGGDWWLHIVGKGGHERSIPLADAVARQVVESVPEDFRGFIFPGQDGGHISPQHVGKLVSAALGDGWSTHATRHRFATLAYQGSKDLRAVQELLGHSSIATTQVYVSVQNDALRAASLSALEFGTIGDECEAGV